MRQPGTPTTGAQAGALSLCAVVTEVEAGRPGGPAQPAGLWSPDRRRLTTGLVLSVTLVAFEALAIATVLPVVSRHLGE